jgi:hypothetical protein
MDAEELYDLIIAVLYLVKYFLSDHPSFASLTALEVSNWSRHDFLVFFSEATKWLMSNDARV